MRRTESPRRRRGAVGVVLVATLALSALHAALGSVTGGDLWWHLAAGRTIVERGEVPAHDPYSYTAEGAVWHNQEWLSQVLFYGLLRSAGEDGLALFKIVVVCAAFALAAWLAWRRSGSLAATVASLVAAAVVCRPYLDIRPNLFAFAGTLVLMALHDAYRRGARVPIRAAVPAVILLWVNLHSSFIYGLGVVWLFAVLEGAKSRFRLPAEPMAAARSRRLVQAAALATAAALVNPQGLDALVFPFRILGPDHEVWRTHIVEWKRTVPFADLPFNPAAFGWLLLAQAGLAAAALALRRERVDVTDLAQVVATAALALGARRFVPLLAFVGIPFAARNLVLVAEAFGARRAGPVPAWRHAAVGVASGAVLVALVAGGVREVRATYRNGLFVDMTYQAYFPAHAVDFLHLNPLPARLFSLYGWGGYLLWRLPGWKVFIDPRAHMVYPQRLYQEQWIAESGDARWRDVLDGHAVSVVLWPSEPFAAGTHKLLGRALRASAEWVRVYEDNKATVFAHRERAREWVERYAAFTLRYPDNPRAQLFLANAYLQANQFARARDQLRAVLRRYPDTAAVVTAAEDGARTRAAATGEPQAWFALGFYREVRDGQQAAVAEAYRTALERGLAGAAAAWATATLAPP